MKKALLFLLLLVSPGMALAQVQLGTPAPDFTLNDTQGKSQSLSAHKGHYVVLEWVNPDCPFVKKHYGSKNMPELQKNYTTSGVVWISINSSAPGKEGYYEPAALQTRLNEEGSNASIVLVDSDGKVGRLYGAQTTPHMFVIDRDGKLAYQGAIDSIPSADPEDIGKAQNYVKQALDELMSSKPVSVPSTKSYGCSVKY